MSRENLYLTLGAGLTLKRLPYPHLWPLSCFRSAKPRSRLVAESGKLEICETVQYVRFDPRIKVVKLCGAESEIISLSFSLSRDYTRIKSREKIRQDYVANSIILIQTDQSSEKQMPLEAFVLLKSLKIVDRRDSRFVRRIASRVSRPVSGRAWPLGEAVKCRAEIRATQNWMR